MTAVGFTRFYEAAVAAACRTHFPWFCGNVLSGPSQCPLEMDCKWVHLSEGFYLHTRLESLTTYYIEALCRRPPLCSVCVCMDRWYNAGIVLGWKDHKSVTEYGTTTTTTLMTMMMERWPFGILTTSWFSFLFKQLNRAANAFHYPLREMWFMIGSHWPTGKVLEPMF